ncbi:MAG: DNA mismatch repair endonuclease MutL [Bacillaceae bacterium]
MGKIHQLDDILSNKIAAGEVVERPASVVKELVENAIDANSTVIEIELEEAGLTKIRIIDNGDGIAKEDALLAFSRHATSKIKDENDLFRIRTLGFRGEALPSIASVSMLTMRTSTGDGAGTLLVLKGGEIETHESTSSRKGTDITVEHLFFNTPARLKYLKTVTTELGNITDVINRLALAHPDVSFKLSHNNRVLLQTSGNGDARHVLAAIYGISIVKKMKPLSVSSLDFDIEGYITLPEVTRASRNYISVIVNGRYVKNYPLGKAIVQGYHTLLPIGRFPLVFLNITMDPLLVDVNVHPSKLEVRFSKEAELLQLITEGIQSVFKKETLIPTMAPTTSRKAEKPISEQTQFSFEHTPAKKEFVLEQVKPFAIDKEPILKEEPIFDAPVFQEEPSKEESFQSLTETMPPIETDVFEEEIEENEEVVEKEVLPPLYPIGQMHGTYILAQNENGLYIMDQHAAQERINYEYFKEKVGDVTKELQELLVPFTIDLSMKEYLLVQERLEALERVGIFLEPFGQTSYIVRSHPTWFPKGEEEEIIQDLIKQATSMKKVDVKALREEAAIMMSCKASIKANQYITNDEIFALLETLRKTSNPFTCPHGRPILIHYSTYELEKLFKRVM